MIKGGDVRMRGYCLTPPSLPLMFKSDQRLEVTLRLAVLWPICYFRAAWLAEVGWEAVMLMFICEAAPPLYKLLTACSVVQFMEKCFPVIGWIPSLSQFCFVSLWITHVTPISSWGKIGSLVFIGVR